jgi:YihY family inner membrane protein
MSILAPPPPPGLLSRFYASMRPTFRYLAETEAHVYALAISASVLLSFYPFLLVILSLCRNVLAWTAAERAIYLGLDDYFPGGLGEFVQRNISFALHGRLQLSSMLLLLFTANGVFEPLEVALNKAWGLTKNRSYLKNQLVALGMIFLCGGLVLLSLILSALNQEWVKTFVGPRGEVASWVNLALFKLAAVPLSILTLFLIYWLLPNRKVAPAKVAPVAIVVGLLLEAFKYVNLLVWPLLRGKLQREYGVFQNSATILLWSFVGSLIVLAGAEWSARSGRSSGEVS